MDSRTQTSLPAMFFGQARRLNVAPLLWAKTDGVYRPLSWTDTATMITELARGLRNAGIHPGDRVMLVSENRPEWFIADLAIMSLGAISVPAYTTNTAANHLHILNDSGAKMVIASTPSASST